jgi:hypothetical protein
MTGPRDFISVVNEAKRFGKMIAESNTDSLTRIQRSASRQKLIREFKSAGISAEVYDSDIVDFANLTWSSARIIGTGIIDDVNAGGTFPIHLSVCDHVSVAFEPRIFALGISASAGNTGTLSSDEFAQLQKGSSYEFEGRICSCSISFDQTPTGDFRFKVEKVGSALARFFGKPFG